MAADFLEIIMQERAKRAQVIGLKEFETTKRLVQKEDFGKCHRLEEGADPGESDVKMPIV